MLDGPPCQEFAEVMHDVKTKMDIRNVEVEGYFYKLAYNLNKYTEGIAHIDYKDTALLREFIPGASAPAR